MILKMARKGSGFTLMELMIVVMIIGILAAIAVPSYQRYVRRARRTDAVQALSAMVLAEETYRSGSNQYGTLAQVWGGVTTSPNGYYTLSISNVSATGYTLTATAGSLQASDTENGVSCTTMVLTSSNGTETRTPAACW